MAYDDYRDAGNFSAVDPVYSKRMYCDDCMVTWVGCWDNFQCPECGEGELPAYKTFEEELRDLTRIMNDES